MERDHTLVLSSGRRIGYRRYGADVPPRLLYLHGRPGSRAEVGLYDEDLLLERGLGAVALDRPGYGLTDPLDDLDPLARAADARELLVHLDLHDVTVQGMSGGGVPALATGVVARDRVRAVVLTSAGGLNDPSGTFEDLPADYREELLRERDDKAHARRDAEDMVVAFREDALGAWRAMTAHWTEPELALVDAKADVLVEDTLEAISHGALGYFTDNMASWCAWPAAFDALDLPVHVFHGERDNWSPLAGLRRQLANVPDVRWTTYEGGDHLSPFVGRDRQAAMLDVAQG